MPENSDGNRPLSRDTSPVMSEQIELSSSTNTSIAPQTTNEGPEDEQIFSTDTDLYGSPGVAFSVKKTGVTYGVQSPPRKGSSSIALGKKTTTNRTPTTSISESNETRVGYHKS